MIYIRNSKYFSWRDHPKLLKDSQIKSLFDSWNRMSIPPFEIQQKKLKHIMLKI